MHNNEVLYDDDVIGGIGIPDGAELNLVICDFATVGGGKRGASTLGRCRKSDVSNEEVLVETT